MNMNKKSETGSTEVGKLLRDRLEKKLIAQQDKTTGSPKGGTTGNIHSRFRNNAAGSSARKSKKGFRPG